MIVQCTANALRIRSLPTIGIGTDTEKRMILGQTAEAHGLSMDQEWLYVDAPAARGWCSKNYLETVPEDVIVLPTASWPKVPNGYDEIVRIFGSPDSAPCSAGRARLPQALPLSWRAEKVTVVSCHKLLEDVFTSVFQRISDAGLWDALENFGGIHSSRTVTSSQKISTHAWGIAGDFDTIDNALGKRPEMHPRIVAIFKDHGFVWGGEWSRPDGMHFQYAKGY